jgi:hypothetical protein
MGSRLFTELREKRGQATTSGLKWNLFRFWLFDHPVGVQVKKIDEAMAWHK